MESSNSATSSSGGDVGCGTGVLVSVASSRVGLAVASVVRVALGVPTETHPEPHRIGVEQFLKMLRFDQRKKLKNCPASESKVGMISELENTTSMGINDKREMPGLSTSFIEAVKNSAKYGLRSE
jgi:hypothetical protein